MRIRSRPLVWATVLVAILGATAPVVQADAEVQIVVVSQDVPISNVELDTLRRIFQFKQRFWQVGRRVTLIYSEENLTSGSFLLDEIYRTDYISVRSMILQKLYAGDIDLAPKVVASDETAVDFVASGSGLIAVVRADAVGERPVKILTVDGIAPDSEDYPLRR